MQFLPRQHLLLRGRQSDGAAARRGARDGQCRLAHEGGGGLEVGLFYAAFFETGFCFLGGGDGCQFGYRADVVVGGHGRIRRARVVRREASHHGD